MSSNASKFLTSKFLTSIKKFDGTNRNTGPIRSEVISNSRTSYALRKAQKNACHYLQTLQKRKSE